jgi:uncharacterized protein with predicted RNA binding PUA domain
LTRHGIEYGGILQEPTSKELVKLRAVADYLFDKGVGKVLFADNIHIVKSLGRVRQVWLGDDILCSIRASDGFIVLNRKGAELVRRALKPPRLRVTVGDDAAPFVAQGKTVFAKHVVVADPEIRPAEEVLAVDSNDRLLASGRALLSGAEMTVFKVGKAVEVRRGFGGKNAEEKTESKDI